MAEESKNTEKSHQERADFLIVTALQEEFDAVKEFFPELSLLPASEIDTRRYFYGEISCFSDGRERATYRIVLLQPLDMGRVQASLATTDAIRRWHPQQVVLVGIAGGIRNKVALGDVIVSSRVLDPELQKIKKASSPAYRDRIHEASPRLLASAKVFQSDACVIEVSKERPDPGLFRCHFGLVASGDKVVANTSFISKLVKRHPEIIGIEMEAAGVAAACFGNDSQPGFLVIKSVSDFADSEKDSLETQRWRPYACKVAAAYLRAFLLTKPLPLSEAKRSAQRQTEEAEALLEEGRTHAKELRFEQAAVCAEKAAELARKADNTPVLLRSLRYMTRNLDNLLVISNQKKERVEITERIKRCIDALIAAGLTGGILALEQAKFARLELRADDALKYAEEALAEKLNNVEKAEALVVCLQASWQKGIPEMGLLKFKDAFIASDTQSDTKDMRLILNATWLRTLIRAKKITDSDVDRFTILAREQVVGRMVSSASAFCIIASVIPELRYALGSEKSLSLQALALDFAKQSNDPRRASGMALEIAIVHAETNNEPAAREYLGIADQWIDQMKSTGDQKLWTSQRAKALLASGDVELQLARKAEQAGHDCYILYKKSEHDVLITAKTFMDAHEAALTYENGSIRGRLDFRLGTSSMELGRMTEAVGHFRRARPRLAHEIGIRAWMGEAEALCLSGQVGLAITALNDILSVQNLPDDQRKNTLRYREQIEQEIVPVIKWKESDAAKKIHQDVVQVGLRAVVAEQLRPLVEWCKALPLTESGHAGSELIDIWGRGGFARVAQAIRMDPCNAIVVDACSIAEIARAARMFCPLYDTVVVKWKGPLHSAFRMVPMPDHLGPPGMFGGQGYARINVGVAGLDDWHQAIGWANYLPKDVSGFIIGAALPLVCTGRLVVLPAALIGCTQNAIGWTDNLLNDGFLGGVVQTASLGTDNPRQETPLQNLGAIKIPFIDHIPMFELNRVLEDSDALLSKLRRLLKKNISGNRLRAERWADLGCDLTDIRDAFRQLDENWSSFTAKKSGEKWRMDGTVSEISVMQRSGDAPGTDPLTDQLRAMVGCQPDLDVWIPYWCLQQAGGKLDWHRPLDNRSQPPDAKAQSQGFHSTTLQGWLFPGDGGPGLAVSEEVF